MALITAVMNQMKIMKCVYLDLAIGIIISNVQTATVFQTKTCATVGKIVQTAPMSLYRLVCRFLAIWQTTSGVIQPASASATTTCATAFIIALMARTKILKFASHALALVIRQDANRMAFALMTPTFATMSRTALMGLTRLQSPASHVHVT